MKIHLYTLRQNLRLCSLDTLELYKTPTTTSTILISEFLRIQFNLFSGQFYLGSYAEYQRLCAFLGVASAKTTDKQVVAPNGFIQDGTGKSSVFSKGPLKFLKFLMSKIRKDCQEISWDHMSKFVDGILLTPSDLAQDQV
jgi:hypothetical protein